MRYSGVVRLGGILMGIGVLFLTVFVIALMLLAGLDGVQSTSYLFFIPILLLFLVSIVLIMVSWRKKSKSTPVFFGIIAILSISFFIVSRGALGSLPETVMLIEGLLAGFLAFKTYRENKQ
ncbi:hypothetical protein [Fredinandcohnia sp. 179-A 10B2 NHS]|uniref:hypothetical protein n=1 Tax=Fredinandcohnia sp. 179-A 10B2 NHS TaxID=3235176 RepID=UPI0039A2EE2A